MLQNTALALLPFIPSFSLLGPTHLNNLSPIYFQTSRMPSLQLFDVAISLITTFKNPYSLAFTHNTPQNLPLLHTHTILILLTLSSPFNKVELLLLTSSKKLHSLCLQDSTFSYSFTSCLAQHIVSVI